MEEYLQRGIVELMNLDGWDLQWCDEEHYNAIGKTQKNLECIIAFKIKNQYNHIKTIKKSKYEHLMQQKRLQFYFVFDNEGNYLYYLPSLENLDQNEDEILLSESQASLITRYSDLN